MNTLSAGNGLIKDMLIKMVLYMYSNWIYVQNYSPILVPTVYLTEHRHTGEACWGPGQEPCGGSWLLCQSLVHQRLMPEGVRRT